MTTSHEARSPKHALEFHAAVALAAIMIAGPVAAHDGHESEDTTPREAVVELAPTASIDAVAADHDAIVLDAVDGHALYLLRGPEGIDEDAFELALELDVRIVDAEVNEETGAPGGDTQSFYFNVALEAFLDQYVFPRVGLAPAPATTRGAGVTVALLDTGLDAAHPAFADVSVQPGVDFATGMAGANDVGNAVDSDGDGLTDELVGHGTFQASLVAAVAPDASLLPIRVLDGDGLGDAFQVAKGIYYAVDQGADVVNLSLSMPTESELLERAISYANDADVVVVAAAGNLATSDPVSYPCATSHVIGVAATDENDHLSAFSSFGDHIDLCAPGTGVVGAIPGTAYGTADGTSGATALVSAAAALMLSRDAELRPEQIEEILEDTTVSIDAVNPAHAGLLGAGRLDVAAALTQVPVFGDLDESGHVGMSDLLMLLSVWGEDDDAADLNDDHSVGMADLLMLLNAWG